MKKQRIVVLGGGIAGLTAAALLAKRGHRVTLIEKESKVGGYVTGFWRQGFYFDATGAFLAACQTGGEFHHILDELGIADELRFKPIPAIRNIYPDFSLELDYRNPAEYVKGVMACFPDQTKALEQYSELTARLGREFLAFEKAAWWRKALMPLWFPTLFRCARHSHGAIIRRFFGDNQRIVQALSALPTTLAPSRLSYIFVAVMWAKVLKQGVFYPLGGMTKISESFAGALTRVGGQLLLGRSVRQIVCQGSKVTGVLLDNEETVTGDRVIGTFNPMLGQQMLDDGQKLYGRMFDLSRYQASPSALLFYIGLPAAALPADWPYFVSIHTGRDIEQEAAALEQGSMENGLHLVITTPSLIDPSLAPAGHHSLKVLVHAPHASLYDQTYGTDENFARLRDRIQRLIKDSCRIDLARDALFIEKATPGTLLRYTGNEGGAMYGFDAACGQVGPQRPPIRTKLDNLLWVGHYTRPAHGIVGSALSGSFAANIIEPSAPR